MLFRSQQSLRPGTESPALASAFAFTSTLCLGNRDERYERMSHCRRRLESALRERIPQAVILGETEERLPHTLSISFPGVDRQALQLALDRVGVACGTGSACASGSSQPSHVLQAMRLDPTIIRGAIRLSLSWETTESEIDEAAAKISQSVARLHR